MEPVVGIEPTTDGLQNRCSTTELNWQNHADFLGLLSFSRLVGYHSQAFCHPKMSPKRKLSDDSGQEDTTNPKLLKVGECLYRRGERGKFYAIIKRNGKQFRRSLKTTDRKLAERRVAVLREKIRKTTGEVSGEFTTFAELADRWIEAVRGEYKIKSAKRRELCIKQLKPFFAGTTLKGVNYSQCEAWAKKRGPQLSESSFNQERETLSMILEYGIKQGVLLDNPVKLIKRRKMRKAIVMVPTKEQFAAILSSLRASPFAQKAANLVELLAYSGMRLAEAAALQWGEVDFERKTFKVSGGENGTKNRKDRVVQLFGPLAAFLKRLRGDQLPEPNEAVVKIDSAKRAMATACKVAGVPNFTHHALRHFFVSNAIEAGIDFATIAGWVGHQDGGVLVAKTYGHLRESHSQKMAERMNYTASN